MTISYTRSSTFTITDAREIASKLGSDLRNLYARHGRPHPEDIADYVEETAQYLKAGYLDTVDYGFKSGDHWILRLRYTVVAGDLASANPGDLPNVDVTGCEFYSHLTRNSAYWALSEIERESFDGGLPISRTPATAPSANAGIHGNGRQYARNGVGLNRDVYRAY